MEDPENVGRRGTSGHILIMRELSHFFLRGVRMTGRPSLGVGAYGCVEEMELNGMKCAGKRIHDTLVDPSNEGAENVALRFVEECKLMSDLRHPHVVQFLGLCLSPTSPLPILVMEHLHCSLDDLLESTPDIPLYMKRSILRDVTLGLVHLHGRQPPIIHRDLTARNVLLNINMQAKLADFGVARILNLSPGKLEATLTRVPGTSSYMPPEVFNREAKYSTNVDIFSFGHVALFTVTQVQPGVEAATYVDRSGKLVARSEVERREESITQLYGILGPKHPFVEIVKGCLRNNPLLRPTVQEVLSQIDQMKSSVRDPFHGLTRLTMTQMMRKKVAENKKMAADLQQVRDDLLNAKKRIVQLSEQLQSLGFQNYENVPSHHTQNVPSHHTQNVPVISPEPQHEYTYIATEPGLHPSPTSSSAPQFSSVGVSQPSTTFSHNVSPISIPAPSDEPSHAISVSPSYNSPFLLSLPPLPPTRHSSYENSSSSDDEGLSSAVHYSSSLSLPSAMRMTPLMHGFRDSDSEDSDTNANTPTLLVSHGSPSPPSNHQYATMPSFPSFPSSNPFISSPFSPPPPQPLTTGMAGKLHFYTDLDISALYLLQNTDSGKIPGVKYDSENGQVQIEMESLEKTELATEKFRSIYASVMTKKVSVNIDVPEDVMESTLEEIVHSHSAQFGGCAFLYDGVDSSIQILGLYAKEVLEARVSLEGALRKVSSLQTISSRKRITNPKKLPDLSAKPTTKTVQLSPKINLTLKIGDLALEDADFIVCPNSSNLSCKDNPAKSVNALSHGLVARQCKEFITKHGLLGYEHSVVTKGGGNLKCKYIIHANPGLSTSSNIANSLKKLIAQATKMAGQKGALSIAFSPLVSSWKSTEVEVVAETTITSLREFAGQKKRQKMRDIRIVVEEKSVFDSFAEHI